MREARRPQRTPGLAYVPWSGRVDEGTAAEGVLGGCHTARVVGLRLRLLRGVGGGVRAGDAARRAGHQRRARARLVVREAEAVAEFVRGDANKVIALVHGL